MDVYNVPEHSQPDIYLIQGTDSNPYGTSLLQPFEAMNEGPAELVVDQGIYFPTATNYGYFCTGLESPGDWSDHQRVFGLDGQDFQFVGSQTESFPYVYYTPSYGYSQSSYNPYNPYIPGAMTGVDGSFVGPQQYYAIPSYENVASSAAYFPMLVQSGQEMVSNDRVDPSVGLAASTLSRANGQKHNSSSVATVTFNPQRSASDRTNTLVWASEGFKANGGAGRIPESNGSLSNPASSPVVQGRGAQYLDDLPNGKGLSNRNHLKVSVPSNGISDFGSSSQGRVAFNKVRPKLHFSNTSNNVNESADTVSEQNHGPSINKSKNHITVKAYTTRAGDCDAQGNIIIFTNQYNKTDFPVNYVNAKFFVIKSYSEDDVHKSIKYNVWSSTPNGNKKLNGAYEDAQKVAAGDPRGCPIFLFFSVNASGQFCGVAEMIGPVDFLKDMDFWQQDKWSGSFPVKWHLVKDVPNPIFRYIVLENNEYKPVTNSRDTQEISYRKGVEILKVFKNYTSKTSLLDDFMYYENRQKLLQEEKDRLLMKRYGATMFMPAADPPRKLPSLLNVPFSDEDKRNSNRIDVNSSVTNITPPKKQILSRAEVSNDSKQPVDEIATQDDVLKFGSLTISTKKAEQSPSEQANVVTVGSLPVKVDGFANPSEIITVGSIPLDPRALQEDGSGILTNSSKLRPQKR